METLDRLRALTAKNSGLLSQAREVHAQAKKGLESEIESVNKRLADMSAGSVLLDEGKQAEYLRLVQRRARMHEHLGE